jgi:hypothetical protein
MPSEAHISRHDKIARRKDIQPGKKRRQANTGEHICFYSIAIEAVNICMRSDWKK